MCKRLRDDHLVGLLLTEHSYFVGKTAEIPIPKPRVVKDRRSVDRSSQYDLNLIFWPHLELHGLICKAYCLPVIQRRLLSCSTRTSQLHERSALVKHRSYMTLPTWSNVRPSDNSLPRFMTLDRHSKLTGVKFDTWLFCSNLGRISFNYLVPFHFVQLTIFSQRQFM